MKAELTEKYIDTHCQEKGYVVKKTPNPDKKILRIDVSNLTEAIPLTLYNTGSLTVGGKPSTKLYQEFNHLKIQISESPEVLQGAEKAKIKACATKYKILH
jgi:hypothetical protein